MLCDICGKNQATVHLTEIINNQMTEMHLCEECARQKSLQMEQQFGLSDLLAGLADLGAQLTGVKEEIKVVKCSNCGMRYEDFKKIGRLGCSLCYTVFRKNLIPLIKRIHGSNHHLGSVPQKVTSVTKARSELQELKEKLQKAIQAEEFEEAAGLRDKIRELEKKMGNRQSNEGQT